MYFDPSLKIVYFWCALARARLDIRVFILPALTDAVLALTSAYVFDGPTLVAALLFISQAELHRDRIYGAHIAEYMEYLTEEDEAKYKEHFAEYIKNEITFDDVEDMYKVRLGSFFQWRTSIHFVSAASL